MRNFSLFCLCTLIFFKVGSAQVLGTCNIEIEGVTAASQSKCKCSDSVGWSCCFDVTVHNPGTCTISGFTLQLQGGVCGDPCCGAYFVGDDGVPCNEHHPYTWRICNSDIRCVPSCPYTLISGVCDSTSPNDQKRSFCSGCTTGYGLASGDKAVFTICVMFVTQYCGPVKLLIHDVTCCQNSATNCAGGTTTYSPPKDDGFTISESCW